MGKAVIWQSSYRSIWKMIKPDNEWAKNTTSKYTEKENQMENNDTERCSLYYRNTQDNIFNLRLARMTTM